MHVTLTVEKYIAHPYWPEKDQVVNILKKSGYNRAQSEDKRNTALTNYLARIGMSREEYDELVRLSDRQWYRLNGDENSVIVIPSHQLAGCLVQACKSAPAGSKIDSERLRTILTISDFVSKKKQGDGVYSRFVLPKGKDGKPLSNQRSLRHNEFISETEFAGTIEYSPTRVKPETVERLLSYAGQEVGVGAARKMGYGRFTWKAE